MHMLAVPEEFFCHFQLTNSFLNFIQSWYKICQDDMGKVLLCTNNTLVGAVETQEIKKKDKTSQKSFFFSLFEV